MTKGPRRKESYNHIFDLGIEKTDLGMKVAIRRWFFTDPGNGKEIIKNS